MANNACQWLLEHLQLEAETRIWPHHFDTGIYFEANENIGLGFGLAMQDSMLGVPYYYFSAYGLKDNEIDFEAFTKLKYGSWINTDDWKGATLELSKANLERILGFIDEVCNSYLK